MEKWNSLLYSETTIKINWKIPIKWNILFHGNYIHGNCSRNIISWTTSLLVYIYMQGTCILKTTCTCWMSNECYNLHSRQWRTIFACGEEKLFDVRHIGERTLSLPMFNRPNNAMRILLLINICHSTCVRQSIEQKQTLISRWAELGQFGKWAALTVQ